jgi:hypothetical protein
MQITACHGGPLMPRELNPELFGPRKTSNAPSSPQMSPAQVAQAILGQPTSAYQMHQASLQQPTPPSVQEFEMNEQTRRKIRDLENQVAVLNQKLEKLSSSFEQRMFQASQAHKALEAKMGDQFREMHETQAAATSKLTERRVADAKIQEMIDRHNQLVLQFEQRMNQIHKIASEQEMKIMTYQATIDEILREIRNTRR